MKEMTDLIEKLNLSDRHLSKGHHKISRFIAAHYDKAVNMTIKMLAKAAEVSESTVVRFAVAMGYDGYPEFQRALQESVAHRLTSEQRFERSRDKSTQEVLEAVLRGDMQNLRMTHEELDLAAFEDAVDRILNAKAIYVMGQRSAAPLAQFLGYYLNYIFDNVRLLSVSSVDSFDGIVRISKDDVLLGISFPRYSKRTLEAMAFAKRAGAQVIAITDGRTSPAAQVAHVCLTAKTEMASFVDSLAAPLSLINALIVTLGTHRKEALSDHFKRLESLYISHSVYFGEEDK